MQLLFVCYDTLYTDIFTVSCRIAQKLVRRERQNQHLIAKKSTVSTQGGYIVNIDTVNSVNSESKCHTTCIKQAEERDEDNDLVLEWLSQSPDLTRKSVVRSQKC